MPGDMTTRTDVKPDTTAEENQPKPAPYLSPYVNWLWFALVASLTLGASVVATIVSLATNLLALLLVPVLRECGAMAVIRREPMLVMFASAFLVLGCVFALSAEAPGDMIFLGNFLPLLLCMPVYVLARRHAGQRVAAAVVALALVGVGLAVFSGLFDLWVRDLERAEGYLTGANVYARIAMLIGFVAGAGVFIGEKRSRFLFCAGPLLGVLAAALAASRGALLAAPPMLVVFVLFVFCDRRLRRHRRALAGIAAAGLVALTVGVAILAPSRIATIPSVIGQIVSGADVTDSDVSDRLAFYRFGWSLFTESVWIGHGWPNPRTGPDRPPASQAEGKAPRFDYHNDLLTFAVAAGIPGVLALLTILAAPLAGATRGPRDPFAYGRFYAVCAIVGVTLLTGLSANNIGRDMPTTAFVMLAAIILGTFRDAPAAP